MPVSLDRFSSAGRFVTYDPYRGVAPVTPPALQCRACGFEPEDIVPPRACPRCYGSSWERFARPGAILKAAAFAEPGDA